MQRDAYSALVKKKFKKMVPLRILQMNGRYTHELVYDDVFIGYHNRRITLMTYGAGQDPRLPRLPQDTVVPSFDALLRLHQPHFRYRLLPLLCNDIDAFAVLQALCAAPHSPFTIDDRVDPLSFTHRFAIGCHGRDKICEFFKDSISPEEWLTPSASRKLPITGIVIHGCLMRRGKIVVPAPKSEDSTSDEGQQQQQRVEYVSSAVLVTVVDMLSEKAILERWNTKRYMENPLYFSYSGNTEAVQRLRLCRTTIHAMGVRLPISPGSRKMLLTLAAQRGVYVYEKVAEGCYALATLQSG